MRRQRFVLGAAIALASTLLIPSVSAQTVYNPPGVGIYNPPGTGVTTYNPPGYGPYNPPGYGPYNPIGFGFGY